MSKIVTERRSCITLALCYFFLGHPNRYPAYLSISIPMPIPIPIPIHLYLYLYTYTYAYAYAYAYAYTPLCLPSRVNPRPTSRTVTYGRRDRNLPPPVSYESWADCSSMKLKLLRALLRSGAPETHAREMNDARATPYGELRGPMFVG